MVILQQVRRIHVPDVVPDVLSSNHSYEKCTDGRRRRLMCTTCQYHMPIGAKWYECGRAVSGAVSGASDGASPTDELSFRRGWCTSAWHQTTY